MKRIRTPRRSKSQLSRSALTPMVDVFTLLLVALLASYSTDEPVRQSDRGFALPRTTSTSAVSPGTTLDLTDEGIYLEDQRLAASQYYLEEDQQLVKEVYWPLLQMEKGSLLIRSDEDIAYRLLEKLIFTAQEAGWESISLVAQSKSSL